MRQTIEKIALKNQRAADTICLIAVSKTQPVALLETAALQGQRDFAENYIKEALPKIEALKKYPLIWHFIGSIQSNKAKDIAQHFDWVHSVDREKIAKLLNDHRPTTMPPLNVCIEINVGNEATKSGVAPSEAAMLAEKISHLPRLKLRGLMALPPPSNDLNTQKNYFKQVFSVFETLRRLGYHLDTLSMGTSQDYPAAIAEGATHVRIGTALFGSRS